MKVCSDTTWNCTQQTLHNKRGFSLHVFRRQNVSNVTETYRTDVRSFSDAQSHLKKTSTRPPGKLFWLKTLSWWNLITQVKTCHFQWFEMSGLWLIYCRWHVNLRHLTAKVLAKNGDSLKFILQPQGKYSARVTKGFAVIQSTQIWVIQSVVLYE